MEVIESQGNLVLEEHSTEHFLALDARSFVATLERALNFLGGRGLYGEYIAFDSKECCATDGTILFVGPGLSVLGEGERLFLHKDHAKRIVQAFKKLGKLQVIEWNRTTDLLTCGDISVGMPLKTDVRFPNWRDVFDAKTSEAQSVPALHYSADLWLRVLKSAKDTTFEFFPSPKVDVPAYGVYADFGQFVIMPLEGEDG